MSDSDGENNGWSIAGFFRPAPSRLRGATPPRRPPKQPLRKHGYDMIEPPQVQDFAFQGSVNFAVPSADYEGPNPPRVTSFEFQGSPAPLNTPMGNPYVPVVSRPPPGLPTVPENQATNALPPQQTRSHTAPVCDVSDDENKDDDDIQDGNPVPLAPQIPPQIPQILSHGRIQLDLITSTDSHDNLGILPPVDLDRLQIHTPLTRTGEFEERSSSPLPEVLQTYFPEKGGRTSPPPSTDEIAPVQVETQNESRQTTAAEEAAIREAEYVNTKPTCSLNLVCYRAQSASCELYQIRTAKRSRFKDAESYEKAVATDPELIVTNVLFFEKLREAYKYEMCSFWRRIFFLKTLRGLRLLSYTANSRPTVAQQSPNSRPA